MKKIVLFHKIVSAPLSGGFGVPNSLESSNLIRENFDIVSVSQAPFKDLEVIAIGFAHGFLNSNSKGRSLVVELLGEIGQEGDIVCHEQSASGKIELEPEFEHVKNKNFQHVGWDVSDEEKFHHFIEMAEQKKIFDNLSYAQEAIAHHSQKISQLLATLKTNSNATSPIEGAELKEIEEEIRTSRECLSDWEKTAQEEIEELNQRMAEFDVFNAKRNQSQIEIVKKQLKKNTRPNDRNNKIFIICGMGHYDSKHASNHELLAFLKSTNHLIVTTRNVEQGSKTDSDKLSSRLAQLLSFKP